MEVVKQPIVAISALLALRSLLDLQPVISSGADTVISEASSTGGAREPTTPGSISMGDPQQAGPSRGSANPLPGVAQSHVVLGRKRKNRGGER
jgi:hypothetical protein